MPENDIDFDIVRDNELECTTNPLSAHRHAANESLVINSEILSELAPGEERETRHILFEGKCELVFPKIFFKGTLDILITPTKYFSQLLLSYSQKLASNSDSIFFAQFVLQQKTL